MTDNQYKNIEQFTIHEAIQNMDNETFVIPSLQRRLVWSNDQMSELFNTIFQNNTFGSLIAIKQTDGKAIFNYYREFVDNRKEADEIMSQEHNLHNIDKENPMYFLLDGQQRLQTFYICLNGKQEDKLYFDIINGDFSFQKEDKENAQWIEAKELYDYLKGTGHTYYNYVERIKIEDETKIDKIKENIFKFYYNIFFNKKITMTLVYPDNKADINKDKKRFIDLFVKLNTGGTVLNETDATLCSWKGLEPNLEDLIDFIYEIDFKDTQRVAGIIVNKINKIYGNDVIEVSKNIASFKQNIKNSLHNYLTYKKIKEKYNIGKFYSYNSYSEPIIELFLKINQEYSNYIITENLEKKIVRLLIEDNYNVINNATTIKVTNILENIYEYTNTNYSSKTYKRIIYNYMIRINNKYKIRFNYSENVADSLISAIKGKISDSPLVEFVLKLKMDKIELEMDKSNIENKRKNYIKIIETLKPIVYKIYNIDNIDENIN